jgi:hypothetical protein
MMALRCFVFGLASVRLRISWEYGAFGGVSVCLVSSAMISKNAEFKHAKSARYLEASSMNSSARELSVEGGAI